MIPFQKIFTLTIRTFSKPVLTLIRKKQSQNKLGRFRAFFIAVGKKYQVFQHWLNSKTIKSNSKQAMPNLKDEILLEKGVEAFYEIMFYCIVIGLPLHQVYKSTMSAHQKQEKLNKTIKQLQSKIQTIHNTKIQAPILDLTATKASLVQERIIKIAQQRAIKKQFQSKNTIEKVSQEQVPNIELKEKTYQNINYIQKQQ